jgi:fused signal recognition particle receptor
MAYVILIIVIAVLAIVTGSWLLVSRTRRRAVPPPPQPPATGQAGQADQAQAAAGTATAEASGAQAKVPSAPPAPPKPQIEKPPPSAGRLAALRGRLARSQTGLGNVLLGLLSRSNLDDETWEEIEDALITADVGVTPSRQITEELQTKVKVLGTRSTDEVRSMLRDELLAQVGPDLDRTLHTSPHAGHPGVVLVVGVNGTGKTTAVGKLARALVGDGNTVLLGAADTFRAAAVDQLQTWGDRVGARTVRSDREGADPASVAFEAVKTGVDEHVDTVIVDTAGRLHTKTGLMDELGKVKRVIEKITTVDEVLLVLDATTGQNGLRQARVFAEVVDITGIVLTKLDGTAKGGIVIAVQRELGVPVKLVGLGEGPDDLAPFEPATFVDAILAPS